MESHTQYSTENRKLKTETPLVIGARVLGFFMAGSFFRKHGNEVGLLFAIVLVVLVTATMDSAYRDNPGLNATNLLQQASLLGISRFGRGGGHHLRRDRPFRRIHDRLQRHDLAFDPLRAVPPH